MSAERNDDETTGARAAGAGAGAADGGAGTGLPDDAQTRD